MSEPKEADDVKLVASLFSPEERILEEVMLELQKVFGFPEWTSPPLFFDRTRYYEKEMGWPLHRRFLSFKDLIRPEAIVDIKLQTNELERRYLQEGRRRVNIDPGYIALERLVLATGKNYTHRMYLSKGIYADLTLVFHQGSFQTLAWTYRDYADPVVIGYFNNVREHYKNQLRGLTE
ncbi:MAG TPA: DUF4416 family protein [Desulfatiglandales bacterium]|nr:DUF4416 family protein [Desulfatiglandales bacterium]